MAENAQQTLADAHARRIAGDYEEACRLYRLLLEGNEALSEAWWGLGLSRMNLGEFEESIADLEKATALEPRSQRYLLDLGKHQTMLGMYDEAKPIFERIIEIDDTSREADEARNQLRYC